MEVPADLSICADRSCLGPPAARRYEVFASAMRRM